MNILKQRILVVVALGGALLCVNASTASAQGPVPPAQVKIVPDCNANGTPCSEERKMGGNNQCFHKVPKSFSVCGEKAIIVDDGTPPLDYFTCDNDTKVQSCWVIKWEPVVVGKCDKGDAVVVDTTEQGPLKSLGCVSS